MHGRRRRAPVMAPIDGRMDASSVPAATRPWTSLPQADPTSAPPGRQGRGMLNDHAAGSADAVS